jgi:hypothetical protein
LGVGRLVAEGLNVTFQELHDSLPHGLHDAELLRFDLDYQHRRLEFDLLLWVGRFDEFAARELYRPARLTFEDVAFLVIEPPDPRYEWASQGRMTIDGGSGVPPQSQTAVPEAPAGTVIVWIYLDRLNGLLIFAAGDASLDWTGPERNRADSDAPGSVLTVDRRAGRASP